METLIFNSNMPVMVNGSPIREFKVERRLSQGDPISPFLFIIEAEGLKGLVDKAVLNGDYAGFSSNGKCFVDVHQFADDMLMVGDGSWNHLWAMKSVLRGFKLISGLGINFHKSKLMSINISSNFMEVATSFLACKREENEFVFLGIPIGCNPITISTWRPLVNKIQKRLNSWKGRYLSIRGILTLLKLVLRSLAIFTLSFLQSSKEYC